jgi:small subunit ribosomal protein S21
MAVRSVNVEVKPKYENENIERMVRRFTKKCKKERIIENFRDRMRYEKPSIKRKKEKERRKKVLEKLRIEREKKLN